MQKKSKESRKAEIEKRMIHGRPGKSIGIVLMRRDVIGCDEMTERWLRE